MKPIRISTIGKIVWLFIFCTILVIIALIVSSLKKEENNLPVKPVSGDEKKVIDYTSSKSSEIDFSKYNSEETTIDIYVFYDGDDSAIYTNNLASLKDASKKIKVTFSATVADN